MSRKTAVLRATRALHEEFGDDRVVDTPLAEAGIAGTAIGMAAYGHRPVPEMQFSGFMYPAFDQIVSHAGRFRNRTRGRYTLPMVLRAPYGGGIRAPESHSESKEMFYAHEAGLKVVIPSTPYDTKGLLISAIRDPDPVIFMEPKLIYRAFRGRSPTTTTPSRMARRGPPRGADVSVFTCGAMTRPTLEAAEELAEEGIDAEVSTCERYRRWTRYHRRVVQKDRASDRRPRGPKTAASAPKSRRRFRRRRCSIRKRRSSASRATTCRTRCTRWRTTTSRRSPASKKVFVRR